MADPDLEAPNLQSSDPALARTLALISQENAGGTPLAPKFEPDKMGFPAQGQAPTGDISRVLGLASQQLVSGMQQSQKKTDEYMTKYQEGSKKLAAEQLQALDKRQQQLQEQRQALGPEPQIPHTEMPKLQGLDDMPAMFGLMMAVGALAGSRVKGPMNAAMGNMTGVLQGWHAGDVEKVQHNIAQLKQNHQEAMDKLKTWQDKVKQINEDAKGDLAYLQEHGRLAAQEQGIDPKMAELMLKQPMEWGKYVNSLMGSEAKLANVSLQMARLEGLSSSKGGKIFIDPETKTGYRVDTKGNAEKQNSDGSWSSVPLGEVPSTVAQFGKGLSLGMNARFASRIQKNMLELESHIENILGLPTGTSLGTLRDVANLKGEGLFEASKILASQKITDNEARVFDQFLSGTALELGYIGSSGVAGGSARHVLDEWNKMAPKAGDSRLSMLTFLALLKQTYQNEVEAFDTMAGASPEQRAAIHGRLNKLNQMIPWDTGDVNRAVAADAGKSQSILDEMKTIIGISPDYKAQKFSDDSPYPTGGGASASKPTNQELPSDPDARLKFLREWKKSQSGAQ